MKDNHVMDLSKTCVLLFQSQLGVFSQYNDIILNRAQHSCFYITLDNL